MQSVNDKCKQYIYMNNLTDLKIAGARTGYAGLRTVKLSAHLKG